MDETTEKSIQNLEIKVENLKKRLKNKQKQLDEALVQIKEAVSETDILKKQLNQYACAENEYNSSWTWISKIVFIVANARKPLRSAEIILLLQAREAVLLEKRSKEKFISAFLNTAIKHQRLLPYKLNGVRGNYYCLPDWIDEKGQLPVEMTENIY